MLFTIKKNTENTWAIVPTSGPFEGFVIANAEGVDLSTVMTTAGRVTGVIKAVWGIQFDDAIDVYSDIETVRALCLGKAFKGSADRPVSWARDGIYDVDSGRILRRCSRMVLLGSSIFRRADAIF